MPAGREGETPSPRGFSLVEIMVALVILALAAGVVALRLDGPLARMNVRDALSAMAEFDANTRTWARHQDKPAQIVIDLDAGMLRRQDADGVEIGKSLVLPPACRMEKLALPQAEHTAGNIILPCSRQGRTHSYAIKIRRGERSSWLLLPGLGGEAMMVENDEEITAILSLAQSAAHNASLGLDAR